MIARPPTTRVMSVPSREAFNRPTKLVINNHSAKTVVINAVTLIRELKTTGCWLVVGAFCVVGVDNGVRLRSRTLVSKVCHLRMSKCKVTRIMMNARGKFCTGCGFSTFCEVVLETVAGSS